MPLDPKLVPPIVVSFVAWGAYRRIKRNVGRQPLQPKRMIARAVILGVVTVIVALASLLYMPSLIGLAIGLLLGIPIAFLGLELTKFESTPAGKFYTPNIYIGVSLSVLFMARLVYRVLILGSNASTLSNPNSPAFAHSPLTTFLFGLLAAYYIAYYIGVILRSHDP